MSCGGLYIKEEEIDALLTEGSFAGTPYAHHCPQLRPLLEACAALETTIAARKAASQRAGVPLRLERARTLFHLSPFDVDTLLVCLAPELHRNYEKLYAYLADGVHLLHAEPVAFETTLRLAIREALLQGAALYWDGFDALLADDKQPLREILHQELAPQSGVTFLAGNTT